LANRELALTRLAELAEKAESASPGPVSLGQMSPTENGWGFDIEKAAGL